MIFLFFELAVGHSSETNCQLMIYLVMMILNGNDDEK